MFQRLTDRLQAIFKRLRGHGKLTEDEINTPLRGSRLGWVAGDVRVVFVTPPHVPPPDMRQEAVRYARGRGLDPVLVDTQGRLHIDDGLMAELRAVTEAVRPGEALLVVDAMTGQDALGVATTFHRRVTLSGVILTKLDGDARGGAALSVRAGTGGP